MTTPTAQHRLPVVVLISGNGTNLQALIDSAAAGLPIEIRAVISNRPGATGLQRAQQAGITTHVIDHTRFGARADFDLALGEAIDAYQPALIVMAGFMRILGRDFIDRYPGRVLNVHPSLLPAYRGLDTHRRALAAGEDMHGVSIHFVTNELDGGPVVAQARVPVLHGDTAETLAARVRVAEHALYPLAVGWFAADRLKIAGDRVTLDNAVLTEPVYPLETTDARPISIPGRGQ
jgi:phosphoribosylglycinamide formyltransferase-1